MVETQGRATQGLVTARGLRAAGVSRTALSRALAAGLVVRPRPRVYRTEPLPPLPRFVVTDRGPAPEYVAHARAALLSLGPGAWAAGRTAAALCDWAMLVEPARTIEIAVSHGRGRASGSRIRVTQRRALARAWVTGVPGTEPLPVTAPAQTIVDCCSSLPLLEAVVVCDSALRAGAVTVEEIAKRIRPGHGVAGAQRVRRVLELCDPAAGSVPESVLRVRMVLAGVSGFVTQWTVLDGDGHYLLRVDFCFPEARLVVEVDGARWHRDRQRDQAIDNRLAEAGWRVLRYGWSDIVHEHQAVVARIQRAASWRPADSSDRPDRMPVPARSAA